jgi:hypothetical protein
MEAEILFHFKIYEKTRGILSILGDRLLFETQPSYRAKKNFYANTYLINTDDGQTLEFKDPGQFINRFFMIDSYLIEGFLPKRARRYYLRARVRLHHVKLQPPLNIIHIFDPLGITTDWKEESIR